MGHTRMYSNVISEKKYEIQSYVDKCVLNNYEHIFVAISARSFSTRTAI